MTGGLRLRCYCGAVTVPLSAGPGSVVNCHCGQCRRLSGAAFTTWASLPAAALDTTDAALQAPAVQAFEVTPRVTRRFCTRCGAHLFTTDTRLPGIVGVPVGALDGPGLPGPSAHYFVDDALPGTPFCDGLPRFGGESGTLPR